MNIKNNKDLQFLINMLLTHKETSKAELARFLKITPQELQKKLQAKNLNIQFLNDLAFALDCYLEINFTDNKYKQKLTTKKEKLYDRINGLNEIQYKLILDILKNLKNDS